MHDTTGRPFTTDERNALARGLCRGFGITATEGDDVARDVATRHDRTPAAPIVIDLARELDAMRRG